MPCPKFPYQSLVEVASAKISTAETPVLDTMVSNLSNGMRNLRQPLFPTLSYMVVSFASALKSIL
ncbi:hypothetical protein R83H12_02387 [Fibrobacteria bacterium R8-3-H12]